MSRYVGASTLTLAWEYVEFRVFVEAAERQLLLLFRSIDRNHDGMVARDELQSAFQKAGIAVPRSRLVGFFDEVDLNHDGYISFDEWRYVSPAVLSHVYCSLHMDHFPVLYIPFSISQFLLFFLLQTRTILLGDLPFKYYIIQWAKFGVTRGFLTHGPIKTNKSAKVQVRNGVGSQSINSYPRY